ncbi:unnamed protein product [Didymodactylos carnosus]|uniref:Uncharacterized protein n=1 Tax=Didymodactylos carnosus TaxID=1234261 RepID=A0A815R3T7_9BILA|nr:unnamed protein product [Didymodactylos carnosus]CAF1627185.1 unnamed protein product [Didymodactylos carnosus]CAF4339491.1 unnamed protein product [Didymodactylos carnosus]CAF4450875.1 unnamed protein product [Didymodactylos carnosus]
MITLQQFTILFQLILFFYEYIVWQVDIDNFTTHDHHAKLFGRNEYFFIVQCNSIPHLFAAYSYYHQINWAMFLYIPYLLLFTLGQLFTWWIPYFFQIGLWHMNDGEKLDDYNKYHAHHHRILPKFRDHPVIPDTEHTILGLLTLSTIFFTFMTWSRKIYRTSLKKKV